MFCPWNYLLNILFVDVNHQIPKQLFKLTVQSLYLIQIRLSLQALCWLLISTLVQFTQLVFAFYLLKCSYFHIQTLLIQLICIFNLHVFQLKIFEFLINLMNFLILTVQNLNQFVCQFQRLLFVKGFVFLCKLRFRI